MEPILHIVVEIQGQTQLSELLGCFLSRVAKSHHPREVRLQRLPVRGTSQQRCSAAHPADVAGHGRVDQQTESNSSRKQKTAPTASSRLADRDESVCPYINADPCPVATAQTPHTRRSLQLLLPWAPWAGGPTPVVALTHLYAHLHAEYGAPHPGKWSEMEFNEKTGQALVVRLEKCTDHPLLIRSRALLSPCPSIFPPLFLPNPP